MIPKLLQVPKITNKPDQKIFELQSKPKNQRQRTFFCRLCRQYGIKTRKAHLKNYHNADPDSISKRHTDDMVASIFVESNDL